MWRMVAPLLESVLKVALGLPECRAWVQREFPDCGLSELEELQARLDKLCEGEGW